MEMLVALAVFGIVMAAINGVFWGALRLRNKTVESVDAALPKERALAIIRNDLANVVPPTDGTFFVAFSTTTPTTNAMSGLAVNSMPGQSSPEFTTTSGTIDDNTIWGDVQRISYQLVDSTNGAAGRDLYRTVTRNLLPAMRQEADQQTILGGVQNIYFYYHDGTVWKSTWDTTNEVLRLPRAIKVQLEMASEERGRRAPPPLELVVSLIDAGTNATTQVASTQ